MVAVMMNRCILIAKILWQAFLPTIQSKIFSNWKSHAVQCYWTFIFFKYLGLPIYFSCQNSFYQKNIVETEKKLRVNTQKQYLMMTAMIEMKFRKTALKRLNNCFFLFSCKSGIPLSFYILRGGGEMQVWCRVDWSLIMACLLNFLRGYFNAWIVTGEEIHRGYNRLRQIDRNILRAESSREWKNCESSRISILE